MSAARAPRHTAGRYWGESPYDAGARKVLELTFREALRLGHSYVGTEHILLALLESEGGTGVAEAVEAEARARSVDGEPAVDEE
ncbi:Clp protease N-terminal domain-containing protein [Streptomyces sp. 24-1644]|uniref:Clp protease N-terminal domain-containing protein n=1 Tax=Streptomyces sp. 24-1644 TaxID=3457315 RepID=UPI003FA6CAE2